MKKPKNEDKSPTSKSNLPGQNRRNFLKNIAAVGGALAFAPTRIMAGPFDFSEATFLVPADKKLTQSWIKSLTERGTPEVLTLAKNELGYVGMPIGGIACGQLYLAGDGRLRLWHIFKVTYTREPNHGNRFDAMTLGGHYADPAKAFERETRPVDQGALLKVTSGGKKWIKRLDSRDFSDITFRGEYPIGKVEYKDSDLPVKVNLEAFSPFIPGQAQESALPATVLEYKVTNESANEVDVDLVSWLENAVLPYVNSQFPGARRSTLIKSGNRTTILYTPENVGGNSSSREDIVFEDFESGSYQKWTANGLAFGTAPFNKNEIQGWQALNKYEGNFFINTHNTRDVEAWQKNNNGTWSAAADGLTGTLTSEEFTIDRNFINFLIGGGSYSDTISFSLLIAGQAVRNEAGNNSSTMSQKSFDVSEFQGRRAKLQITDNKIAGWGHISLDHIVFSDSDGGGKKVEAEHGYGSMAISMIDNDSNEKLVSFDFNTQDHQNSIENIQLESAVTAQNIAKGFGTKMVGAIGQKFKLQAGESKSVRFLVTWFFPYLNKQDIETGQLLTLRNIGNLKRHYFNRFNSANQVADYIQLNSDFLVGTTKDWNKTWYDSSLPYWLLDRSFIPNDCLASNTAIWFDSGRFWAWEGVECCPGTCLHVWHYAQGMARIFPEIERYLRESIDLGSGLNADGSMGHRDETGGAHGKVPAHDGHCGTIIRIYREHRMSADNSFLQNNYQNAKKAIQFIINEDKDKDGLLEGTQTNTLDAAWYGPMGWISSLYLGALAVGKEMALEMDDPNFANVCDDLLKKGQGNIVSELYNGEYFIHKPDASRPDAINSNDGCLIDQVLGQSLAFQSGLRKRVIPVDECRSALDSIWKYNFAPDAFLYQAQHKPIKGARIYATSGEAGTLMCTWPHGGADRAVPGMASRPDESETWLGPGGYFDECMNGFEYQVASHMIFEDEVEKGLALAKAVHERYGAVKRNPYNEIECGDHYSRSMAAYGVFIAACGFNYHGPKGEITFAPKISVENFKAPFTVAEGWGTYSQERTDDELSTNIDIKQGQLIVKTLNFELPEDVRENSIEVKLLSNGVIIPQEYEIEEQKIQITTPSVTLNENNTLQVIVSYKLTTTGLFDSKVNEFRLYPNPSRGNVKFEFEKSPVILTITNLSGIKSFEKKIDDESFEHDFSDMNKGTYVATVNYEGTLISKKMLII